MAMEFTGKKSFCIVLAILALLFANLSGTVGDIRERNSPCNGSIADCYAEAEFLMDSEIYRRFLKDTNYISYNGLGKERPAGGNAKPGNPYTRGCEKEYYCRQGS
ncbi:protein RALF-like 33 [Aristolochia californica]|uniref:protein RALF-like 33 n=1 Tax=Aristolochia californica TaxID=171875 RepID=UPI0035DBB14D